MSDVQVFFRAHKTKDLNKEEVVEILCPLDGFSIEIDGEVCKIAVSQLNVYFMSEAQYNTLLIALKNPNGKANGCVLDCSTI